MREEKNEKGNKLEQEIYIYIYTNIKIEQPKKGKARVMGTDMGEEEGNC